MTLVVDERLKHRLVGLLVVASLAAIFIPAFLKHSNKQFDSKNTRTVALTLPQKPALPETAPPKEETMFKRVKVAHVQLDLPEQVESAVPSLPELPKRTVHNMPEPQPVVPSKEVVAVVQKPVATPPAKPIAVAVVKPRVSLSHSAPQHGYSVQLATLREVNNAKALVSRLLSKGYKARLLTLNTPKGVMYKVLVGNLAQRSEAWRLQEQLVSTMQLKGMVVAANGSGLS